MSTNTENKTTKEDQKSEEQTVNDKPTPEEVMRVFFSDNPEKPHDNFHWVLFENGTFYSWKKQEHKDTDALLEEALRKSREAYLIQFKNNDDVATIALPEFNHPVIMVLSCLGNQIGWIIVSESKVWPATDQQWAAVGYVARQRYELDCEQNHVIAASFPLPKKQ